MLREKMIVALIWVLLPVFCISEETSWRPIPNSIIERRYGTTSSPKDCHETHNFGTESPNGYLRGTTTKYHHGDNSITPNVASFQYGEDGDSYQVTSSYSYNNGNDVIGPNAMIYKPIGGRGIMNYHSGNAQHYNTKSHMPNNNNGGVKSYHYGSSGYIGGKFISYIDSHGNNNQNIGYNNQNIGVNSYKGNGDNKVLDKHHFNRNNEKHNFNNHQNGINHEFSKDGHTDVPGSMMETTSKGPDNHKTYSYNMKPDNYNAYTHSGLQVNAPYYGDIPPKNTKVPENEDNQKHQNNYNGNSHQDYYNGIPSLGTASYGNDYVKQGNENQVSGHGYIMGNDIYNDSPDDEKNISPLLSIPPPPATHQQSPPTAENYPSKPHMEQHPQPQSMKHYHETHSMKHHPKASPDAYELTPQPVDQLPQLHHVEKHPDPPPVKHQNPLQMEYNQHPPDREHNRNPFNIEHNQNPPNMEHNRSPSPHNVYQQNSDSVKQVLLPAMEQRPNTRPMIHQPNLPEKNEYIISQGPQLQEYAPPQGPSVQEFKPSQGQVQDSLPLDYPLQDGPPLKEYRPENPVEPPSYSKPLAYSPPPSLPEKMQGYHHPVDNSYEEPHQEQLEFPHRPSLGEYEHGARPVQHNVPLQKPHNTYENLKEPNAINDPHFEHLMRVIHNTLFYGDMERKRHHSMI